MTSAFISSVVAFILTAGFATQLVAAQQADYIVGPEDVLTITIWDEPQVSGKFSVDADGTFTFPLIGRVKAGGRTLREIEAELMKRLTGRYFKNPQISVSVEQYRSQRIFLVGEIRQPGAYPLSEHITLIEALARAGSTTTDASHEAIVVRSGPGRAGSGPILPDAADAAEVFRVDLRELQKGLLSQNFTLNDGDTVFIPRVQAIYVFGQVRNPGSFAIRGETTVLQALSLAGGVTERGALGRIKVSRTVNGESRDLKVSLNDLVAPGDTIVVPTRFF